MRSWRNFSKAWMSKILSLTGCEQLMMNFLVIFCFLAPAAEGFFYIARVLSLLFYVWERRDRSTRRTAKRCTYCGDHLE
jgi:hypothetical protein